MKGEVVFEMDSLQLDVTLTITNDKLKYNKILFFL